MPVTTGTGQGIWARPSKKQGVVHEWSSPYLAETGPHLVPPPPGHHSKDLLITSSSQTAQATGKEGWKEEECMFGSPMP